MSREATPRESPPSHTPKGRSLKEGPTLITLGREPSGEAEAEGRDGGKRERENERVGEGGRRERLTEDKKTSYHHQYLQEE